MQSHHGEGAYGRQSMQETSSKTRCWAAQFNLKLYSSRFFQITVQIFPKWTNNQMFWPRNVSQQSLHHITTNRNLIWALDAVFGSLKCTNNQMSKFWSKCLALIETWYGLLRCWERPQWGRRKQVQTQYQGAIACKVNVWILLIGFFWWFLVGLVGGN